MATKASKHRGVKLLELAEGRWVARWRDPVSRKQVQRDLAPLGLTNEKARERWAIEKLKALQADRARLAIDGVVAKPVTVAESHKDYLATFANGNSRSAKVPPLASIAEHLTINSVRSVQDITAPILAAWGDHVRRPGNEHKVSTRNWHLLAVAAWLRWCRRRGTLPRVTDDQIKDTLRRQKEARNPIEILQPAQLRDLLAACLAHDAKERDAIAPFVCVVLGSGMRFAEACGLTWAEVDAGEKCIRLGAGRTKTQTHRVITLAETPFVLDVLAALRLRGGRGRVFPHLDRSTAESARLRTMASYSAPTWTWHRLRRTCGSLLVCAGLYGTGSPFMTAKRLGHSLGVAERHYLGALTGLPRDAKTLESAAGIEKQARQVLQVFAGAMSQEAMA